MQMKLAEVADKYTILMIKSQKGLPVSYAELEEYQKECVDNNVVVHTLHAINIGIWHVESQITKEESLEKIGELYLKLRRLNHDRITEKNRISKEYNEPLELKQY